MRTLRIATRRSPLALWQARHVAERLKRLRPGASVELVEMTTEGDRFLSAPLSAIGGKGLFVKEIERAVLDGEADLAVHSLKDMTSAIAEGLVLAAVPEREDPRDALVAEPGMRLSTLPPGARVGTSSLRRTCQLRERRPDVEVVALRGNVQTRLRRAEEMKLTGAILALAGLRRLGLEGRVAEVIDPELSLPAVGQGALAVECRGEDAEVRGLLAELDHLPTRTCVTAERAFLAILEGGCTVPLAAYAQLEGGVLRVRGLVGRPDGARVVRAEVSGPREAAERLGRELGERVLREGGGEILQAFAHARDAVPES